MSLFTRVFLPVVFIQYIYFCGDTSSGLISPLLNTPIALTSHVVRESGRLFVTCTNPDLQDVLFTFKIQSESSSSFYMLMLQCYDVSLIMFLPPSFMFFPQPALWKVATDLFRLLTQQKLNFCTQMRHGIYFLLFTK